MAQSKILVDTNSYIRLAKTIHPLLYQSFGDVEYCLYVLPELNKELASHKLESRFHWINDAEYSANRKRFPTISRAQRNSITSTFEHVWEYVKSDLPISQLIDGGFFLICELRIELRQGGAFGLLCQKL